MRKPGLEVFDQGGWWTVYGKDCTVSIEARPFYCDRGNFLAKLHPEGSLLYEIDHADGWPRYYFAWNRMLAEINAWLVKRGQRISEDEARVRHANALTLAQAAL